MGGGRDGAQKQIGTSYAVCTVHVGGVRVDGWMGGDRLTPRQRAVRVLIPSPIPLVRHQRLSPPLSRSPPPPVQFPEADTRWRCEDTEGARCVPSHKEEDAADSQIGEKHEEPDAGRKWVQEGEVARFASLEREIKTRFTVYSVTVALGRAEGTGCVGLAPDLHCFGCWGIGLNDSGAEGAEGAASRHLPSPVLSR